MHVKIKSASDERRDPGGWGKVGGVRKNMSLKY